MFNTTFLLLDPEDSPLETKQSVTNTVLHEIAHMWFGNLVTMKYLDGLWLKEGFATLMSWVASDRLYPNWHLWDNYVSNELQSVLELDSLVGSHPVEVVLQNDSEVKQIYDDISYDNGRTHTHNLLTPGWQSQEGQLSLASNYTSSVNHWSPKALTCAKRMYKLTPLINKILHNYYNSGNGLATTNHASFSFA
jgi:hypothetical protein